MPEGSATSLLARAPGPLAVALLVLAAVFWLLAAAGRAVPSSLERSALAAAALLAVVWGIVRARRLLSADPGAPRRRLLAGLLLLALPIAFVGIGHEAAERYYLDEGSYFHHATRINSGEILRPRFVYPHLLFYLDAFALRAGNLFRPQLEGLTASLAAADWATSEWLFLRWVTALLGALTVLPVFLIAERLNGRTAAALAALLMIFSPLFHAGFHVNTSDVPSAFFAALSLLFAVRLLDGERLRDYVLAGLFAGLAASTKYPAGVVAVAIVAVWARGCLRDRRPIAAAGRLLAAGGAALAAFIGATPSLLAFPRVALLSDQGVFFGVRQYAGGGWIGVQPTSHSAYFGRLLLGNFGAAALLLAAGGVLFLSRRARARLAWALAFPAAYLTLVVSMNMVVERNVYPAIPALAAGLGVGISGLVERARRLPARRAAPLAAAITVLAIAAPAGRTLAQTVGFARPSTRQLATAWIAERLPAGAAVVKESYTPRLTGKPFIVREARFAARIPMAEIRVPEVDYLLLSVNAYLRFLDPRSHTAEHHASFAAWYREALEDFPLVREFAPGTFRLGPHLKLLRVAPSVIDFRHARSFDAEEAFAGSRTMSRASRPGLIFKRPEHWAMFKGFFAGGDYRLKLAGDIRLPGRVAVIDGDTLEEQEVELLPGATAELSFAAPAKRFFYLQAAPGSVLRGLAVDPAPPRPEDPELTGGPG